MKYKYYIVIFCFFMLGCNHPESKKFERNRGNNKEFNSSTDEINFDKENSEISNILPQESSNVLKMELQNGVRYVWIEINGIKLRFIFDTGASNICISPAEATVLYRQGTLQKEDILEVEYFQDATGNISEGTKINLREVRIGNMVLENVEAIVVENVKSPLLLGQSVLERFGRIEIDNLNDQIIFKN